jgi:hypothetical protein
VQAVYVGNVIQSSNDACYLSRHVGLKAGVPVHVPALTINRCASSPPLTHTNQPPLMGSVEAIDRPTDRPTDRPLTG